MILVVGATGFLGNRVCELLEARGARFARSSLSLGTDLRDFDQTRRLFEAVKPEAVINCAGYNGNIHFGMTHTADIFHYNMLMIVNLLEACRRNGVKRLVNPIANCTYPAKADVFREEEYWDGPLHPSVVTYGIVRKASTIAGYAYHNQYGLDVMSVIMSNMYGPGDHFDEERSHALGGLVMKAARARREREPRMVVWGTGKPVREWLYIDDGAEAMIRALDASAQVEPFNIGHGEGVSIGDLARKIADRVGYQGELFFDTARPDGAPYKTMDGSKGAEILGWQPEVRIAEGLDRTISWYMRNIGEGGHGDT